MGLNMENSPKEELTRHIGTAPRRLVDSMSPMTYCMREMERPVGRSGASFAAFAFLVDALAFLESTLWHWDALHRVLVPSCHLRSIQFVDGR